MGTPHGRYRSIGLSPAHTSLILMFRHMDLPCGISIVNSQQVVSVARHSFHFAKSSVFSAIPTAVQLVLSTCISQTQKSVSGSKRTLRRSLRRLIAMSSYVSCVSSIAQKLLNHSCRPSSLARSASHLKVANLLFHLTDAIVSAAAERGLDEVCIGMPHRGRLNMLANIAGKSSGQIFQEFQGPLCRERSSRFWRCEVPLRY